MSELKVTFFTDQKLTYGKAAALLEFSTGENKVVNPVYESDLGYEISKCIREINKNHSRNEIFYKL